MATEAHTSASPLAAVQVEEGSDLQRLLEQDFRPPTAEAQSTIEKAVQSLAQQALSGVDLRKGDAVQTIDAIIAAIDAKVGRQLDSIMHHPDFQKLEGAWRGLKYLVDNTETDETLKIRVMHVKKDELGKMFRKFEGIAWDQSPLFKAIYEAEYGTLGGAPYGCLVGDYQFDQTPPDIEILSGMAKIAAAAHAPFVSSPSPALFQMKSWQELANPRDLTKIFEMPEYAEWRAFRKSEDSRYVGLAMPRFLARLPYGASTNPATDMAYEEKVEQGHHESYTWANSAYAMATNITRAFKLYGWTTAIRGVESGGNVDKLKMHTFASDDGGVDIKCPTEIAITDRREGELAKNGMLALVHRKNSNEAVFMAGDSVHKPPVFDDAGATANARLGARLPYIFATCRFAHYLKCMVRDKVGGFTSASTMQRYLQDWILNYVYEDTSAPIETLAARPLAGAEVTVVENKANPGYYNAQFFLRPHYQLEGLNVGLRLVSELPSQRGAA
ncbi:MAG: type VI secretion system contractile sheath large subunit [Rubrivivax sp.]